MEQRLLPSEGEYLTADLRDGPFSKNNLCRIVECVVVHVDSINQLSSLDNRDTAVGTKNTLNLGETYFLFWKIEVR